MWPIVQTGNFIVVPVRFQLLVVNLFCFFDDVFISFVQHRGMPKIFAWFESSWYKYLGADVLKEIEDDMNREEEAVHASSLNKTTSTQAHPHPRGKHEHTEKGTVIISTTTKEVKVLSPQNDVQQQQRIEVRHATQTT